MDNMVAEYMDKIKKEELLPMNTDLCHYVITSNDLAEARQSLKLNSTKIIRLAIMQIKAEDKMLKPYKISIPDLAKILNIQSNNIYSTMDEITRDILTNPIYMKKMNKNGETTESGGIPWAQACFYERNEGLTIKLNDILAPHLLQLKEHYMQYELEDIVRMKSVYGIRLYEMLIAHMMYKPPRSGTHITIPITEIKRCLDCENYEKISHFKERVLDAAKKEINENSSWTIDYKCLKTGREITDIEFSIVPVI